MMNLPRPRWPAHEIAVIGGSWEDDLAIAGGYLRVAEIGATHWSQHGPDDSLPIPVLYNYRHSVELSLKWLIRTAARIVRRGRYDTGGANLDREKVDKKLREDSHSIKKLAERLNTYLGFITDLDPPNNRIDDESQTAARAVWRHVRAAVCEGLDRVSGLSRTLPGTDRGCGAPTNRHQPRLQLLSAVDTGGICVPLSVGSESRTGSSGPVSCHLLELLRRYGSGLRQDAHAASLRPVPRTGHAPGEGHRNRLGSRDGPAPFRPCPRVIDSAGQRGPWSGDRSS